MAYIKKEKKDYGDIGRKTNVSKGLEKKQTISTVILPSHKKVIASKYGSVSKAIEFAANFTACH
jgi:hypothetical protein